MSAPGPKPRPSLLRLVGGEEHKERVRDDKPKIAAAPAKPPGTVLSVAEQQMWEWLLEHVYMPGVHGTGDGAAFVEVARLWARVLEADEQVRLLGLATKNTATGKLELQPYARISRDLWRELRSALAEIGGTPSGRVRIASPLDPAGGDDSWSRLD